MIVLRRYRLMWHWDYWRFRVLRCDPRGHIRWIVYVGPLEVWRFREPLR